MRFLSLFLFILFNIYLIESANRTESENSQGGFESERSEIVPGIAQEKSDNQEETFYDEYEYDDGRENSILEKNDKSVENSTDTTEPVDGFPNEVFLSLRNITADAATAFRSFTSRNDVVDLQASASDNLNVTANSSAFGSAEYAGINLRALRDAGHPPQIIDETGGEVMHLPYKHTKIDTADLSDCALQGEWKPMGVAHGHLHVGGDNTHQIEVLQSVGSYAVPNRVIPHWQQNHLLGGGQDSQDGTYNHKPSGLYASGTGGGAYGPGFGYGSGSGFLTNGVSSSLHSGSGHYYGGGGSLSGSNVGQFQKIKSASMLSPPPVPSIIFGKKPGYWKLPKTKHKFFPGKGRRPGGYPGGGSYGFLGQINHGSAFGSGHSSHGSGGGYPGGTVVSGYFGHGVGSAGGGFLMSGGSGHFGQSGGENGSGTLSHTVKGGVGGASVPGYRGAGGVLATSGGPNHKGHGYVSEGGVGVLTSGGTGHWNHGFGGENGRLPPLAEGSGIGHVSHGGEGGPIASQLIGGLGVLPSNPEHGSGVGIEEVSGDQGYVEGGQGTGGKLISASSLGSGGGDGSSGLVHSSGGLPGEHSVSLSHSTAGRDGSFPEAAFLSTELNKPSGTISQYPDSTFSSSHISQGLRGGNSLPDAAFLSSHINQDFAVHGQGVSDDLSSSSTFTCGKNHDHNTNYHTATFQVADHDHPSSVDVLQYGGDAAVLIQSGDASFHDQILPERKHYKTSHLTDTEVSGSDNKNELTSQTAKLTSNPIELDVGSTEAEPNKAEDEEEPERHSYYHEITKVTKIPATSVGSVQYTFSQYETKPQSFSTESEVGQEEPEVEQPQIIRELEHLSNKFQLDLDNPQKLFEDPPSQELAYHYPFQEGEHDHDAGKVEAPKEEDHEGKTEFPYQFYHNKLTQHPVIYKKPAVKYIPRPGKPQIHQKTTVHYLQPKPPLVVLRKYKPKHFLKNKQNYEVHEHGGERRRPIGEIFPPQKFPKQFHNPKPNFAVDRPKNGWRPDVQEYVYDHSHGKKIRKFKTKAKLVAPILIRRPVSPAPVIRVVEVAG